jgi:hypothetical protein
MTRELNNLPSRFLIFDVYSTLNKKKITHITIKTSYRYQVCTCSLCAGIKPINKLKIKYKRAMKKKSSSAIGYWSVSLPV